MSKDLTTIYQQYPAMFRWFTNAYGLDDATAEFGAAYIYECLATPSSDNAMWQVLEAVAGGDFQVDRDLLIDASHAIIETTKLNTKGTKHE